MHTVYCPYRRGVTALFQYGSRISRPAAFCHNLWLCCLSAVYHSALKKVSKKLQNFAGKIWKLIKKSYLCTPIWKTGGWWGWEFLERLAQEWWLKRNFEKSFKKVWKFENNAYLCSPVRKTGSRKRIWEVHWKDWLLYKKQVPRNTIYREALILLEEL